MDSAQARLLVDRLMNWYRGVVLRAIRKGIARVASVLPSLALPAGWALLTWSMFQLNPRAWAASVGIFLLVVGLVPVFVAYFEAKQVARRQSVDR